jgi:hypothetical protein
MSVNPSTSAVSVGSTATAVINDATTAVGAHEDGRITYELFNTGPNTCYLGASGVTTSTGIPLPLNSSRSISVRHGAELYAICASAESASVRVLVVP